MGSAQRILTSAALCVALAGCGSEGRGGARGSVGYTVMPPSGWQDITRRVEERTGVAFDVAYGGPTVAGTQVNVNITRRDAGEASLEKLVRTGREEVDELAEEDLDFSRAVRTEIDGAPALRYDFETSTTRVRQVAAVHEGGFYVVTLTAPARAFGQSVPRLDGMLRTWSWD